MGQVIELLKSINYQVSKELLFNYKKINIEDRQLIILIYLIIIVKLILSIKGVSYLYSSWCEIYLFFRLLYLTIFYI